VGTLPSTPSAAPRSSLVRAFNWQLHECPFPQDIAPHSALSGSRTIKLSRWLDPLGASRSLSSSLPTSFSSDLSSSVAQRRTGAKSKNLHDRDPPIERAQQVPPTVDKTQSRSIPTHRPSPPRPCGTSRSSIGDSGACRCAQTRPRRLYKDTVGIPLRTVSHRHE
jgi:hypothetical protein